MSVENKIKELLGRAKQAKQELTEESTVDLTAGGRADIGAKASVAMTRDTSKAGKAANAGDTSQPRQGSSQDASFTTTDEDDENLGAKNASSVSKDNTLPKSKGDAKAVKVPAMEEEEKDSEEIIQEADEVVEEFDIQEQLNSIFGEDLSEEFKQKAASIFEAAVVARVNAEMESVVESLEQHAQQQIEEYRAELVEKVDSYLNYVVEQWLEENALAVETGIRTEIAEDFIHGLKQLFQEHYIEVPEDKYDVVEELQQQNEELKAKLDESINRNIEFAGELVNATKQRVFEEVATGLTVTEVARFQKLVEGIEFGTEELYREKVEVIKENYFPKTRVKSPERVLVEEAGTTPDTYEVNPVMAKYVESLSRSIKTR